MGDWYEDDESGKRGPVGRESVLDQRAAGATAQVEPVAKAPPRDVEHRFHHDALGDLRGSVFALAEHDGDLADPEPLPPRAVGELDLEGIPLRRDAVR